MPTTEVGEHPSGTVVGGPGLEDLPVRASWARNANWVKRMPSAAAISSWNQLSPSNTKPVTAPPSPSANATNRLM